MCKISDLGMADKHIIMIESFKALGARKRSQKSPFDGMKQRKQKSNIKVVISSPSFSLMKNH